MPKHADRRGDDNSIGARRYWETRACGSIHAAAPKGSAEYFQQADDFRYSIEPVERFAGFSEVSGKRILEIGTGMGGDFARFSRAAALAVGVDLSPTALDETSARLRLSSLPLRLARADAAHLPFADEVFDLVWSWGVLHHVIDIDKAITELRRTLRPGGEVRIMLYHRPSWVAVAAWCRALLRGRPRPGLKDAVAENVESPGTLALTVREIERLMRQFARVEVRVVGTYWDRKFVPLLGRLAGRRLGWFALVSGAKAHDTRDTTG